MKRIFRHFITFGSQSYQVLRVFVWNTFKSPSKYYNIRVFRDMRFSFLHYGYITKLLYTWEYLVSRDRGFEYKTLDKFLALIAPGDVVFDIGANIGLFSLIGAKAVGEKGVIHAFEPAPETYDAMVANIERNGCKNIVPCKIALSNEIGTGALVQSKDPGGYDDYAGDAFNYLQTAEAKSGQVDQNALPVALSTLDAYVAQHNIQKVKLIKIDIEGSELLCFRGGEKLLSSPEKPIIIFECVETYCRRNNYTAFDVLFFLHNHGYKLEQFDEQQWLAYPKDYKA